MKKPNQITLDAIDKTASYEGYLWMSDMDKPTIIEGTLPLEDNLLKEAANPFIAEGFLYNEAARLSYSLKYVDGQTRVYKYELEDKDFEDDDNVKEYYGNRMGDRRLKFREIWEPVPDAACEGMAVLQLRITVFIGFKK